MKFDIEIRSAAIDDAEDILKIYRYYIINTAVSFEYNVPTLEEFKNRIKKIIEKYPYYVALIDNRIIGYAYSSCFIGRDAYRFSAELSIYIDKKALENFFIIN